jgi:hypothetical protein
MTWWHDDISDQQRVNAIASRDATKLRRKQLRNIDWDSAIERFQQTITGEYIDVSATTPPPATNLAM